MHTDPHSTQFFAVQRYTKRMSWLLFGLFLWVGIWHLFVLFLLGAGVIWLLTGELALSWAFWAVAGLGLYFVVASFIWSHRLNNGGQSIAKRLGAIRLFYDKTGQTGDEVVFADTYIKVGKLSDFPSSYARFYEFAEQMSLASGVPCPKLYVLPNESGINGFVAGFDDHDTVLVLTQGAVEKLNNEALYALIGHEFGHILHGDAKLNLRLYVLMAGFSLFYECADWLEELLLGKFHANYHTGSQVNVYYHQIGAVADGGRAFRSLQAWREYQITQANISINNRAVANVFLLPVMGVLVLVRVAGVFGMESVGWLKSKFNHQRELLADATSVQLTRSLGMVALLKIIEKHDTALYSTKVSAVDYFFFANPAPEPSHFLSHPTVLDRLNALGSHAYDTLGLAIVDELDLSLLQETHDHIARHAPVLALQDEAKTAFEPEYHSVALEQFGDVVVDGRLVIDKQWHDWSANDDNQVKKSSHIYPHLGKPNQETADEFRPLAHIKLNDLAWGLAKHLKEPLGLLVLFEMAMLCRFEVLDLEQEFDLQDIFINLPNELPHKNPKTVHEQIFAHAVNADSLTLMAKQPRADDVALLVRILGVLPTQLASNALQFKKAVNDNANAVLNRYGAGLVMLFGQPKDERTDAFDPQRLMTAMWQGALLAGFCGAILQVCDIGERVANGVRTHHIWQMSERLCDWSGVSESKRAVVLVLAGAVLCKMAWQGVIDDNQLASLVRWGKLLGLTVTDQRADWQVVCQTVSELGVGDWASLMWLVGRGGQPNDLDTLHTAFLCDGCLGQQEQGVLAILAQLQKQ